MALGNLRKKPKKIPGKQCVGILRSCCRRRVPLNVSNAGVQFSSRFLDLDEEYLEIENTLSHLEDVRRLHKDQCIIFFPFHTTLLKAHVTFVGLSTVQNVRALKFSLPPYLISEEKRSVKRIKSLPSGSGLTFTTADLGLWEGKIVDVSPGGLGFNIQADLEGRQAFFKKGAMIQAELVLSEDFKLSFEAEVRYFQRTGQNTKPPVYKIGARIIDLAKEARGRFNEWLFKVGSAIPETKNRLEVENKPKSLLVQGKSQNPNAILVIGSIPEHQDFWLKCLGRKYEVVTSDANIANIRTALGTNPALVLVHIEKDNPTRASLIRKFCQGISGRYPLVFFAEEPREERQKALSGDLPNKAFVDISERKLIQSFRQIDEVMSRLK